MLVTDALPVSLALIMFSLGFGLTFADFGRVFRMPRAVLTGMVLQVVGVPLVALVLLMLVDLPPAIAFGVMLLSFCPGGVTSNILTRLAGGTVALSITLTAVVSLLSVVTVPALVDWAAGRYLGDGAPAIDVTSIAASMFAITVVPVLLGLFVRRLAPDFADRTEPRVAKVATGLFVLIVLAAIVANWDVVQANALTLGPIMALLNVVLLVLGVGIARGIGLSGGDGICISIEMGVQNAALGIAVAGLVAQSGGIPEFAVPAAVYGITMYVVTLPAVFVLRALFGRD